MYSTFSERFKICLALKLIIISKLQYINVLVNVYRYWVLRELELLTFAYCEIHGDIGVRIN